MLGYNRFVQPLNTFLYILSFILKQQEKTDQNKHFKKLVKILEMI